MNNCYSVPYLFAAVSLKRNLYINVIIRRCAVTIICIASGSIEFFEHFDAKLERWYIEQNSDIN